MSGWRGEPHTATCREVVWCAAGKNAISMVVTGGEQHDQVLDAPKGGGTRRLMHGAEPEMMTNVSPYRLMLIEE